MRLEMRHRFRCDICGHDGFWGEPGKEWASYGCLFDIEEGTDAHVCSRACREELDARLADGRVVMAQWKRSGPMARMKRRPRGFGRWAA